MGDRLATIDMGRKFGGCSFLGEGELGPHVTMQPGPRPIFVPSGIFIHPAVWLQQTWAKIWGGGLCRLGVELGLHLT